MSAGWIERRTADGSSTLAHPAHGETLHSVSGAWTQARERYARECRLRERAHGLARAGVTTLRLCDMGTGLGLNLAAALEALDGTGIALEAWSFERDGDLLARVAREPREPADLERWHGVVREGLARALPDQDVARSGVPLGAGRLHLLLGDARESIAVLPAELRFDAVFLDPFSPRVEPDLWQPAFLAALARHMAPGSILSTYSAATAVRAALVAAGLRVGLGARVGEKREGTLASPDRDLPPFPARVARRLASRAVSATQDARFGASGRASPGSIP